MSKNTLYLLAAILAVLVLMLVFQSPQQDATMQATEESQPTNGMVGSTTEEAAQAPAAPETTDAGAGMPAEDAAGTVTPAADGAMQAPETVPGADVANPPPAMNEELPQPTTEMPPAAAPAQ